MKKGLVLEDPKMSVMDMSTFPAELTLSADRHLRFVDPF